MRKKRWIAPVWGMLAAAAFGQTASAQGPGSPLDGPFPPVGPPMAPPPTGYAGQPTYTPIAPDPASPAGFPPGMEAWPTISPFDHAVDTTYNDNGIWFREMLNHKRTYQVDVEFISARFRQPGNVSVGAIGELTERDFAAGLYSPKDSIVLGRRGRYFIEMNGTLELPDGIAQFGRPPHISPYLQDLEVTRVFGEDPEDGDTDDFIFAQSKLGIVQVVNTHPGEDNLGIDDNYTDSDGDDDEVSDTLLYPVTGGVFGDDAVVRFGGDPNEVGERIRNPASPGLRLTFGLEDEDGSGFAWSGMWVGGETQVFRRGHDDPLRPVLTNVIFFHAPHIAPGAYEFLDYNVLFELRHETEEAGTDLAFYTTPMADLGWFRMRPLYGVRYNYVRETFGFTGRDTGDSIVYNADGTPKRISPFVPTQLEDPVFWRTINPYQTDLTSKVRSHLYGPQIGFDMQMGGEYLMLTAITKAGLVANTEKLTIEASGFGSSEAVRGIRMSKTDSKTHTHISPFVEFNANADINVFPIIPYVNRMQFFKNARVRAGWTGMVVGNMQRPMETVVWQSDLSGGPYIKDNSRDHWYTQYWNLGVHWNF